MISTHVACCLVNACCIFTRACTFTHDTCRCVVLCTDLGEAFHDNKYDAKRRDFTENAHARMHT